MTSAATPPRGSARRPRILFLQTQAENAGAQEIARLVAAGLEARGHEVHQIFFYRRTGGFDEAPRTSFCCATRPSGPIAVARFFARLVSMIRAVEPDVVVTFQHYGNFFGVPAARLAGVRKVVANQNTAPEMINGVLRAVDRIAGSVGLYSANVVNSTDTERAFAGYPAAYRARMIHIDHGFECKVSRLGKAEARARFALPAGTQLVGTVGRLNPMKNMEAVLRVLPRLPGVHFALAGQGDDRPRLEGLVADLGLGERVHFVGELGPEGVADFLKSLDAFVFPTRAETFGLAGVEAAQAGVPVVANRLPVLQEVLAIGGEPCALFVDADDPDDLAAGLARVLGDADLAARLSAAGRRLEAKYSLGAMVDGYARLIADLGAPARAALAVPAE